MRQSHMITFILYRPSRHRPIVCTSSEWINSYLESTLIVQEFLDYEHVVMGSWLQEKFHAELQLQKMEDRYYPYTVLVLVDGVPAQGAYQNIRCDIEAIIRDARTRAQAALELDHAR